MAGTRPSGTSYGCTEPVQHLQDELTCSICCEVFQHPLILDCGHSFCRACITRCREEASAHVSWPQCRSPSSQNNFRPNWQLANVVERAKQLNEQLCTVLMRCPCPPGSSKGHNSLPPPPLLPGKQGMPCHGGAWLTVARSFSAWPHSALCTKSHPLGCGDPVWRAAGWRA
uniref:RING-type domain-containing protein n=1 Tax=Crocodylus porosus TaxID=8502 RepID=A0A7M4FWS5_CROPO